MAGEASHLVLRYHCALSEWQCLVIYRHGRSMSVHVQHNRFPASRAGKQLVLCLASTLVAVDALSMLVTRREWLPAGGVADPKPCLLWRPV